MRERVKDSESKEKMKQSNAKKQYDYIKKLEKLLIESGCSADELEDLKNRNMFVKEKAEKDSNLGATETKEQKEGEVEDQTVDRYLEMKN